MHWELGPGHFIWECFCEVRRDLRRGGRFGVGAGAKLDLHNWPNVRGSSQGRRIVEEQRLGVWIVGVRFQRPGSRRRQEAPDLQLKIRTEDVSNVILGGELQLVESLLTLFVARSVFRSIGATEAQELAVDDDVDVFGEAVDQLPALGQRRTAP